MHFDLENNIVKQCAYGMQLEGEGKRSEAAIVFENAWTDAQSSTEKYIAAHYLARHQASVADKLHWDMIALDNAMMIDTDDTRSVYPSLYLNIAKCYEDLGEIGKAYDHYKLASDFIGYLPNDGYGNMIRSGVAAGLERSSAKT